MTLEEERGSLTVHPGTFQGTVSAPPSKSYTHRALILAGLSRESTIRDPLRSQDTLATLAAVKALGATVEDTGDEIRIQGGHPRVPEDVILCHNSGTTLRLATAVSALASGTTVLTGDASLRTRPMGPLLDALWELGADAFSTRGNGRAPVVVRGPMEGGAAELPGDVSSQFVSGLVLAGARTEGGVSVRLTSPLRSRPYVDMTLATLEAFGGEATGDAHGFDVPGDQALPGADYRVPGDYSSAAFPLAAAAVTGGRCRVENLPPEDPQGDRAFLQHLEAFGAPVTRDGDGVTVEGSEELAPVDLDLGDTPDLFPVLCALAAHADGTSRFTGAAHLRHKESDRIDAMVTALRAVGVEARELEDGAEVTGGPVKGGRIETRHDHRILMAGTVLALGASDPVSFADRDSFKVSYPAFLTHMRDAGIRVEVT